MIFLEIKHFFYIFVIKRYISIVKALLIILKINKTLVAIVDFKICLSVRIILLYPLLRKGRGGGLLVPLQAKGYMIKL